MAKPLTPDEIARLKKKRPAKTELWLWFTTAQAIDKKLATRGLIESWYDGRVKSPSGVCIVDVSPNMVERARYAIGFSPDYMTKVENEKKRPEKKEHPGSLRPLLEEIREDINKLTGKYNTVNPESLKQSLDYSRKALNPILVSMNVSGWSYDDVAKEINVPLAQLIGWLTTGDIPLGRALQISKLVNVRICFDVFSTKETNENIF